MRRFLDSGSALAPRCREAETKKTFLPKGSTVHLLEVSGKSSSITHEALNGMGMSQINPYKSFNSCQSVISEPDLLYTSGAEVLKGFSDQGQKNYSKKDAAIFPTKHLTLTFICPALLTSIESLDLSSIESIWSWVTERLACNSSSANMVDEVYHRFEAAGNELPVSVIHA
ncbi:hypothetical protein TNCV_2303771 [Trichonephila clavipes]|nr:hypothetical protein TNCV_2303771 [Trichonephila clavipes]